MDWKLIADLRDEVEVRLASVTEILALNGRRRRYFDGRMRCAASFRAPVSRCTGAGQGDRRWVPDENEGWVVAKSVGHHAAARACPAQASTLHVPSTPMSCYRARAPSRGRAHAALIADFSRTRMGTPSRWKRKRTARCGRAASIVPTIRSPGPCSV